jgi:hypothetical protein
MTPRSARGHEMPGVIAAKLDPTGRGGPTLFCTQPFVEAWVRSMGGGLETFALSTPGSAPGRLFAVSTPLRFGKRHVEFGPMGLPAGPCSDQDLSPGAVSQILRTLQGPRVVTFTWHVRFDHRNLALELAARGLSRDRVSTHVLPLDTGYEKVFARFNSTTRNLVRSSRRRGVKVRDCGRFEDFQAYYQVYTRMAEGRGNWSIIYPLEVIVELASLEPHARFLVAEIDGRIAAGALFFLDTGSVRYWISATDRAFSAYNPIYAVLDEAIRWACELGALTFDFGASREIASLERFKAAWGAIPEPCDVFTWRNPIWRALSGIRNRAATLTHGLGIGR